MDPAPEPTLPPLPEDALDDLLRVLYGPTSDIQPGVVALCERFPDLDPAIRLHAEHVRRMNAADKDGANSARSTSSSGNTSTQLGPYRLLQRIGQGGFGEVWSAEQREPVRRQVAIKLIKLGMDSEEVLRRFAQERQALSMMDHPCVAHIYDAGLAVGGRPYFAMEYVGGVPITRYCDENKLSLRDRIELFQRVCSGVQHAHMKGVMHRDLKPSNILVGLQDGKAIPKIIDFGLAKAMDHRLIDATLFTERGKVIGTPEYMSPEQAGLGGVDIDTRTDVYSLGVLLYELLTGELPFSRKDLPRSGATDLQKLICEADPIRPSTRVTTVSESASEHARRRGLVPIELRRRLHGDLDWIVLKALEKDRSRRYQSPAELAADLGRHLEYLPVLASPPSLGYRMRKFVRRYRAQCAGAAIALLALIAGGVATWVQFERAEENAALASQRAEELGKTAAAETTARREADEQRQRAEASLANYDLLAIASRLEEAKRIEETLWPALPEKAQAMRDWLRDHAEPLVAAVPRIDRALAELQAKGTPTADTNGEPSAIHPHHEELRLMGVQLASIDRAQAVRDGRQRLELPALDDGTRARSIYELNMIAWNIVNPDAREYGNEPFALACAHLARTRSEAGETTPELTHTDILDTVAWACLAVGLDTDATRHSEAAAATAPKAMEQECRAWTKKLQEAIAVAKNPASRQLLHEKVTALRELCRLTAPMKFADGGTAFLYKTLGDVRHELFDFADSRGRPNRVKARLDAAQSVKRRTLDEPSEQWRTAVAAIQKSDGVTASTLYQHLTIEPIVGLVPVGMDPVSKLWEFVHLASGSPHKELPTRDPATGLLLVNEHMGIVLVLVPGGSFTMGCQSEDPNAPNYDPQMKKTERLANVTLTPYLLGKYELTRAQWRRLTNDTLAAGYDTTGTRVTGDPRIVDDSFPATRVSWVDATHWLQRHGLTLPTEAQWEYASRAHTTTSWWTGATLDSVSGAGNIFDRSATRAYARNADVQVAFDDGFCDLAPVGHYRANPFGLHDVIGNVREWCKDDCGRFYYEQWTLPRDGDGLRFSSNRTHKMRAVRGGSFMGGPWLAAAAHRDSGDLETRNGFTGLRAAKALPSR